MRRLVLHQDLRNDLSVQGNGKRCVSSEGTLTGLRTMSAESRSRMVSFRVTSEEYERFRQLCYVNGIASVSEMARAAINLMFSNPERKPGNGLEVRLAELEGRLNVLALEFEKLMQKQIDTSDNLASRLGSAQSA